MLEIHKAGVKVSQNKTSIKENILAIEQADDIVSSINEHRLAQIIEQCNEFEKSLKASERNYRRLKQKKNSLLKRSTCFMIMSMILTVNIVLTTSL